MPLEIFDHREQPAAAAAETADTVTLEADLIGTKDDGRTYLVAAAGAVVPRALFAAHQPAVEERIAPPTTAPGPGNPEVIPSEAKPAFPATARKGRDRKQDGTFGALNDTADEDEVTA